MLAHCCTNGMDILSLTRYSQMMFSDEGRKCDRKKAGDNGCMRRFLL